MLSLNLAAAAAWLFSTTSGHPPARRQSGRSIKLTVADGILKGSTDGHVQLIFAPAGSVPLDNTDVSSNSYFFGQNVFNLSTSGSVLLSGGNNESTDFGLYGFRHISLDDVAPGDYSLQAFMNVYETVTRPDGSTVSVKFPCGDGSPAVGGVGSLITSVANVTLKGAAQAINLVFNNVTKSRVLTGKEIGGCQQGNYADTNLFKHVKIRSDILSKWWKRDVYVGANILLPFGYSSTDTNTRYPVIYSHGHWPGADKAFGHLSITDPELTEVWNKGTTETNSTTPRLILVNIRHENAFYDDSYGVNTANLGPWGDAINDELIPYIDKSFNTIAAAYARIQEGGSTGGWISIASVIYRPDLFGACFTSYPDPLDFHRHQDIPLYTNTNAYLHDDGVTPIISVRSFNGDTQINKLTVAQENHWELTFGTSSRSIGGQWDVWNAVYGVQGLNGYPLEPWDKVTGEIYPEAVELWKPFDLAHYITTNWNSSLNLGTVLKNRLHVYVGLQDDYFLNEGVAQFQSRIEEKGGVGWANFTYGAKQGHGGLFQLMSVGTYLKFLEKYVQDHAPDGQTPLSPAVTTPTARGNKFEDVIAHGGRAAALARQADPVLTNTTATVGKWDPGVKLRARWIAGGKPSSDTSDVRHGVNITYSGGLEQSLQLEITGAKRGYKTEVRKSNLVAPR